MKTNDAVVPAQWRWQLVRLGMSSVALHVQYVRSLYGALSLSSLALLVSLVASFARTCKARVSDEGVRRSSATHVRAQPRRSGVAHTRWCTACPTSAALHAMTLPS
jgi:hypothetical protein